MAGASPLFLKNPGTFELAKVIRDGRLAQVEVSEDLLTLYLAACKKLDDLQSWLAGQRGEDLNPAFAIITSCHS
jgi:hypothetical protein